MLQAAQLTRGLRALRPLAFRGAGGLPRALFASATFRARGVADALAHNDEPSTEFFRRPNADEFVNRERNHLRVDEKSLKDQLAVASLDKFSLTQATQKALAREGVAQLFPVQAACFDHFMSGKDVIVRARTGTGKTLAFALPIVEKLMAEPRVGRGPAALVMAPTRELALQVKSEFDKIAPQLSSVCVYGGAAYGPQETALRHGVDVVVGTPGRLVDHLERGTLRLSGVRYIVLDEADRMLDQGFEDKMEALLTAAKEDAAQRPQTCLFSATLPAWIRKATNRYLTEDRVTVDLIGDDEIKTAETVDHKKIRVQRRMRETVLHDLVTVYAGTKGRCIIFTETKADADRVAASLPNAQALHGDIAQSSREVTLDSFRKGKINVLVATDVAARGLDIPEVQLVVQVQPPRELEAYIHRSGRTGRAGKSGVCITLFSDNEQAQLINSIERHIGLTMTRAGVPQPHDLVMSVAANTRHMLDAVDDHVVPLFLETAKSLIEEKGATQALSRALAALTGSKSTEPRSLMDATPGFITMAVKREDGRQFERVSSVWRLLESVAPRIAAEVSHCMTSANGQVALFDVPANRVADLKDMWNLRGFSLEVATSLPPLRDGPQDRNEKGKNSPATARRRNSDPGRYDLGSRDGRRGDRDSRRRDDDWGRRGHRNDRESRSPRRYLF